MFEARPLQGWQYTQTMSREQVIIAALIHFIHPARKVSGAKKGRSNATTLLFPCGQGRN
jgi:hypothetical protein